MIPIAVVVALLQVSFVVVVVVLLPFRLSAFPLLTSRGFYSLSRQPICTDIYFVCNFPFRTLYLPCRLPIEDYNTPELTLYTLLTGEFGL